MATTAVDVQHDATLARPVGRSVLHKALVALSGLALAGWAVLHMAGTLTVFGGPDVMNGYAQLLRSTPLLWVMRGLLLFAFSAHIVSSVRLWRRTLRTRGTRYRVRPKSKPTARWMPITGALVGAWLVFHVLHMYGPMHDSYVPGDVYGNLVLGLRDPVTHASYVVATVLFCMHLRHGLTSAFQSLGLPAGFQRLLRPVLTVIWWALLVGFLAPSLVVIRTFGLG